MTYLDSHIAILIIREHNTRYCFRSILSENLSFILARIPDTSDDLKNIDKTEKETDDTKADIQLDDQKCYPCKRNNVDVSAKIFCIECCENICETGEEVHRRLRPTKNHRTTNCDEKRKEVTKEQGQ